MTTFLDVPDGLQVKETWVTVPEDELAETPEHEEQGLSFYTGRWEIEYSREEVMDLMDALHMWLERTQNLEA